MKTLMLLAFSFSQFTFAMDFQPLRLSVWKKGESYFGHDLIMANESVADYFAALPRPTDPMRPIKYDCQVKLLDRELKVNINTTSAASAWANILMVYEAKDCKAVDF